MRIAPNGESTGNVAEGAFSAALRGHAAADRLAADRERQLRALRESGAGWEAFKPTVLPALRLHQARPTRTGTLVSAFRSNDDVHHYEGVVLGMRQRILAEAISSDLLLPARFEFAAPAVVATTFHGMRERGYFTESSAALSTRKVRRGTLVHIQGIPVSVVDATLATAPGNWELIQKLAHGVPMTEAQQRAVQGWAHDLGSAALAQSLFVVSHAHDGAGWVPLDLFRTAERRILASQEL